PELGEDAGEVGPLDELRDVGLPSHRIHRIARAVVGAQRIVAPGGRRDVHQRWIGRVQLLREADELDDARLVLRVARAAELRWRTWIDVDVVWTASCEGEGRDVVPLRADVRLYPAGQRDAVLAHLEVERE